MRPLAPVRLLAIVVALTGVFALTTPASATAAKPCWKQIVDDWYGNERIDGHYTQRCYAQAESNIPQDLRDYSDLPAEIARARARDLRDQPSRDQQDDPGRADRVVQSAGPVDERNNNDKGGGASGDAPGGGPICDLLEAAGPSSADSAPIPLLVLAGLALLLVAAGAAGLLTRRLQARRGRTTPPGTPDA